MNVSAPASPARLVSPSVPGVTSFRWEGHMAEDGGFTSGPLPRATLTATSDELCLQGTRGEFHLPRTAILRIGRGKLYPWFFCALQFHHTLPLGSRELQFMPMTAPRREVRATLRALGYPVG